MKTFNFWMLLLATSLFLSCGDDDGIAGAACGNSFNFQVELQAEANALTAAATAYAQDPTTENCNAYVVAFNDYLDAAEDLEECALLVGQAAEYNAAIDEARADLNSLQC